MTSISDLKTDGIGGPLQVRILRKWKHDVRQYETWYLAVDRFADAIQILRQRTNQSYIESVLHVSQCYTISDYSCPQLDNYQKFLENEFYIDVGLKSIIQRIPDTITIPKTWFRFVSKSHLINLGERPPYYPDYIGVLSKIRDCTKASGESFVLLILTDESELAINLWKECITNPDKFNRNSLHPPPATTVVAVTNLKPSIYNGVLRYGSSHATHIYASIKEFHYQNSWFQAICPICKDPIFKRGESWYCSAHGLIEKPTYMYKLTVTITDATDTISALISETSCRKLLKSSLENFISNNPHINRNTLPPIITNHKEQTKKMSIQMLRASNPDNIRFIIIDIEDPTTRAPTSVPATPAQPQMTRMRPSDTTPEPSTPVQHVARALTYDPTESTPRKNAKRTAKQQTS
ncbi:unnamed protein product [Lactuca virosa]|uniref:Replication factor A C-terminal domain-containing protein n=1 Tax=Lactuca virosa TaxID=75947 RepID=A0AAU9MAN7_9ASTR|nr:unnamed protein product [Lactuca virosa]